MGSDNNPMDLPHEAHTLHSCRSNVFLPVSFTVADPNLEGHLGATAHSAARVTQPTVNSERALPGLDGVRAASIAFVLLGHLSGTRNFPDLSAVWRLSEFGVRIFFVISGYLITSILVSELTTNGRISFSRFYLRRTLRLFPAMYIFVATVALLAAMDFVTLKPLDLTFALAYAMSYHNDRAWTLGHLWSLSIEEQFYLLWPVTLAFLGPKRAVRLLIGILAIAPLIRLASPLLTPISNFFVWSDALGSGCALAILGPALHAKRSYASLLSSRWFFWSRP